MKKTLLIALAAGIGGVFSHAEQETLFSSDFASDAEHPYGLENPIPGWLNSDLLFWLSDEWIDPATEAAIGSNGYFGEISRRTSDSTNENSWLWSGLHAIGGDREYTVTFVFKPGTDPGAPDEQGNATLRIHYHANADADPQDDPLGLSEMFLINDGVSVGEEGFESPVPPTFDEITISDPDANGWRTITVVGTTAPGTGALALVAEGWNIPGQDEFPERFFGSFGVDYVEITTAPLVLDDVAESTVRPAVELRFFAEADRRYLLRSSDDLQEWSIDDVFLGTGETQARLFSTRNTDRQFFRVLAESIDND